MTGDFAILLRAEVDLPFLSGTGGGSCVPLSSAFDFLLLFILFFSVTEGWSSEVLTLIIRSYIALPFLSVVGDFSYELNSYH